MGKISEPEGGQIPTLTVFDNSDNVFSLAPLEINYQTYQTNPKGVFHLREFIGKKIERLVINGKKIAIPSNGLRIEKTHKLEAHVNTKILRLL